MNSDARILFHLLRGQSRQGTHVERLQRFYAPQAHRYDAFRERLLQGRGDLIYRLAARPGDRVVELGGGTGRNLRFFGGALSGFTGISLVDLCPALLEEARKGFTNQPNLRIIEADATRWQPEEPVDCVYFSYSLTMIPDWQAAIDNAVRMLRPGGTLGVVDFYVSSKQPRRGMARHSLFSRQFWPRWFRHDGVHLGPERQAYLRYVLPAHELDERRARVPYLPGLKVPYYLFVGRKPVAGC